MEEIKRGEDGVDHINVYSKGKTQVGQLLSNFAATPFSISGLLYRSVEGWWYWRLTGVDRCRFLAGFDAKEFGRVQTRINKDISPDELLKVYQAKADQNPAVKRLMQDNAMAPNPLPYDHYYVYGGKVVETKWRWTGQLWNKVVV